MPPFDGPSGEVYFKDEDVGSKTGVTAPLKRVAAARLPTHEMAWATTVHKSQGMEFDRILLVLLPAPSPVLTRELLYTAVTRAKQGVTILGSWEVFKGTLAQRIQRSSGIPAVFAARSAP